MIRTKQHDIALFVTCLVDLFRPQVGFAAVKLLESKGSSVAVPAGQTCCGQPAYNNGDRRTARRIARRVIRTFRKYEYVVVPSGSCAGMIKVHYPQLFDEGSSWHKAALELGGRTYELVTFITEILGIRAIATRYDGIVAYHDSCSALRELGVRAGPRELLGTIAGLTVRELAERDTCCGFGGTFCVKYPDISNQMVGNKIADIERTGADTVLSGDLGCLMNIAGKMKRDGKKIRVLHVAEVLAGMGRGATIGDAKG